MGSGITNIFKGAIIQKRIGNIGEGLDLSPPRGHSWIVLSGYVVHLTGTETMLVSTRGANTSQIFIVIPAAIASMVSPLFNVSIQTGGQQTQWIPHVLTDADTLSYSGDSLSFINLEILDFVT